MGRNYNRLRRLCAFIIGAVFFVSGILKLLDPVGAGLVAGEYFRFLGMDFLLPVSKHAGFALAMLEALLGTALMTGLWRRVIAVITLVFLCGSTLLTLMLLIYNPEMDCGCFGEAIHLTHAQTFIKNVVLCALSAVAFTPIGRLGRPKKICVVLHSLCRDCRVRGILPAVYTAGGFHRVQACIQTGGVCPGVG